MRMYVIDISITFPGDVSPLMQYSVTFRVLQRDFGFDFWLEEQAVNW